MVLPYNNAYSSINNIIILTIIILTLTNSRNSLARNGFLPVPHNRIWNLYIILFLSVLSLFSHKTSCSKSNLKKISQIFAKNTFSPEKWSWLLTQLFVKQRSCKLVPLNYLLSSKLVKIQKITFFAIFAEQLMVKLIWLSHNAKFNIVNNLRVPHGLQFNKLQENMRKEYKYQNLFWQYQCDN